MPSILVEMAFHNNEIDAGYLKEPLFRKDASRVMVLVEMAFHINYLLTKMVQQLYTLQRHPIT